MNKNSDLAWTFLPSNLAHSPIYDQIRNFNEMVEKALDEYMMFKYSISGEQIKKIVDNTNNFKLKHNNFQKVVQCGIELYFDGGELFLTVDTRDLSIYKHWR